MQKLTLVGKVLLALLVGTLIATSIWAIRLTSSKPTPPPAPQMIEWLVDEYGDKEAKLPNGLTLYVSSADEGTSTTWSWSVSGEAATEQEAKRAVLHLGGVR